MRVLVTGGAGFVGSHLCDALIARGDSVLCVDDLSGPGSTRNIDHLLGSQQFEWVKADLVTWDAELRGIDLIFHEACTSFPVSMADPERDLRTNILGTLRLLHAAERAGIPRFVHASSGSVFGESRRPQTEDELTRPASFYGVSKLAGESYVRLFMQALNAVVLRYYNVIGPRQDASADGGVVPIFITRAMAGKPLIVHGSGEQVRSFTAVEDVVRANLLMAERTETGFYNVGSGVTATINELAGFISDEIGPVPIEHGSARQGDVFTLRVDPSRIESLGWTYQPDWRTSVRRVIESLAP